MSLLKERLIQKYRTLNWPKEQPQLSSRYRGKPVVLDVDCGSCNACLAACPTLALHRNPLCANHTPTLDMGRCIFCGQCAEVCPKNAYNFSKDYHTAVFCRQDMLRNPPDSDSPENSGQNSPEILQKKHGIFGRSFKLRQVSAGGCGACEADCNVLGTLVYDLGRFGIEFTASPRHADAIVLTGPISRNMLPALLDAWQSVPLPRVLVAVGACAISGGLFHKSGSSSGGTDSCESVCHDTGLAFPEDFKVDVYIPGCPPNPWSILEGLLMARQCR